MARRIIDHAAKSTEETAQNGRRSGEQLVRMGFKEFRAILTC
jgi:hypothetical protein